MASQGNFRDQYIASVPAGSVVILHYGHLARGDCEYEQQSAVHAQVLVPAVQQSVRFLLGITILRTMLRSVVVWNQRVRWVCSGVFRRSRRHFRTRMWNRLAGDESLDLSYRDKWGWWVLELGAVC